MYRSYFYYTYVLMDIYIYIYVYKKNIYIYEAVHHIEARTVEKTPGSKIERIYPCCKRIKGSNAGVPIEAPYARIDFSGTPARLESCCSIT